MSRLFASGACEDENLRGRRFDSSEARERCVSNGPQGEPRSGESSSITDQIRKACSMSRLFASEASEDENLRGRRFDSSEARERCVSNGPQGEPRSGESSSITDQIRKACSMSRLFASEASEDENLRGRRFDSRFVGPRKRSAAGHHQCTTGQKYHQNHNKRLYSRFQPAIRYFVTSSIAFFIDEQIFFAKLMAECSIFRCAF